MSNTQSPRLSVQWIDAAKVAHFHVSLNVRTLVGTIVGFEVGPHYLYISCIKVGRSKPPPVLTSGFNHLKPPWSVCQKVVNTGQYESEWSIENFKWPF